MTEKQPFREPCDWWFHSGPTVDKHGNQVPKGPFYCANKKSVQYLSRTCPRQTCDDYAVVRDDRKVKSKECGLCGRDLVNGECPVHDYNVVDD